jgi:hypothetical protein
MQIFICVHGDRVGVAYRRAFIPEVQDLPVAVPEGQGGAHGERGEHAEQRRHLQSKITN